jgi:hypothetical protein
MDETGTGAFKLGANYAPAIMPQKLANDLGYTQNLWLEGPEHYLTEVCCGRLNDCDDCSMESGTGRYHESLCRLWM